MVHAAPPTDLPQEVTVTTKKPWNPDEHSENVIDTGEYEINARRKRAPNDEEEEEEVPSVYNVCHYSFHLLSINPLWFNVFNFHMNWSAF